MGGGRTLGRALTGREASAALRFVRRVRAEVRADLVQASLFGSKSRGDARPDSDVDVLLVFERLPPDREPHASVAERIADLVAADTGIPVTAWSVALSDLVRGSRTPMLVDALDDAIPLWCRIQPLPTLPFTPDDAARCVSALLDRVAEGGQIFRALLDDADRDGAAIRLREDVVRMCTALLLLRGVTRPRRAEAVRRVLADCVSAASDPLLRLLDWAAASYGPDGRGDPDPPPPPPGSFMSAAHSLDALRGCVLREAATLRR